MKNTFRKSHQSGFALVVTLSLMILLTVIAVGLLGLSSITLRSAGQGAASATARSNARLAMMLALGELQASLGPDKSASAPASSVYASAKRPRLTGVWKANGPADYWHWTPTAGGSPSYSQKAARFSRWLVSTATPSDAGKFSLAAGNEPTGNNAVILVGDAANPLTDSLNVTTAVMAEKIKVGGTVQPGKYGWAVFDESAKAAIDLGDPQAVPVTGLEIASRTAPGRLRADILANQLVSLKTPEKIISLETATVPGGAANRSEFRRRFHDFTTGSKGLLTNPAEGGLKTDLTSLFEPSTLPSGAFAAPTAVTPYPEPFGITAGAPKWAYLRDHYRKYKTTTSPTTEPTYSASASSDLKINTTGLNTSPDTERLIPVIAKFQLLFSVVSHYEARSDRRNFLNTYSPEKNYTQYGAIHLVYDPVITLYNPYDVTLNLAKTRIRIWDPPVGFRFTKIPAGGAPSLFRSDGEFLGLARFQVAKEGDASARKCFTLVLADGSDGAIGPSLRLKPGEVKVFSPRVQPSWNWGTETAGMDSFKPQTFFDYDQGANFGNQDFRTRGPAPHTNPSIIGNLGVESVPGWIFRAGLQTDHLALRVRDEATLYPFEKTAPEAARKTGVGGWVNVKLTDEVKVEATPKVSAGTSSRHFQVDVLAGLQVGDPGVNVAGDAGNAGVQSDTLRSYKFNFDNSDPAAEISTDPSDPIIERQFTVGSILQKPTDALGGKKAFAMLEMSARTTKDEFTDSKPWLYNNVVVEGGEQDSSKIGLTHQSYDLRFVEINGLNNFPDGVSIDPTTKRGYFGPSSSPGEGSSFVNMLHVPLAPAASLGDLVHANMASSALLPRVVHPFGNSRAHPLIPAGQVATSSTPPLLDHSYLLNDSLWDSYYFSTLTNYTAGTGGGVMPSTTPLKEVLGGVFGGTKPALNSRMVPAVASGDPAELATKVAALSDFNRSRQLSKYVAVNGPFNVNSTSVDAWRAVLSSLRDRTVNGLELTGATGLTVGQKAYANADSTPFVRAGKPLSSSTPPLGLTWAGYRALSDAQITDLARKIVAEIKLRGIEDSAPSLSLGEFVNRRPGAATHRLAGLLQTAIDKTTINDAAKSADQSKALTAASISPKRIKGVATDELLDGESVEGAPTMLTQGDLMAALAPVATVRGDTFKIRCYGEATGTNGTTVVARAWCEAVVQRAPEFVDPTDPPETAINALTKDANKNFGRRFDIVSFRWLSENEI